MSTNPITENVEELLVSSCESDDKEEAMNASTLNFGCLRGSFDEDEDVDEEHNDRTKRSSEIALDKNDKCSEKSN